MTTNGYLLLAGGIVVGFVATKALTAKKSAAAVRSSSTSAADELDGGSTSGAPGRFGDGTDVSSGFDLDLGFGPRIVNGKVVK